MTMMAPFLSYPAGDDQDEHSALAERVDRPAQRA
jgi:hypothetical protein